jgi:hypothetical protein
MVIRSSRPPGDPDGTGTAVLPTNAREFEICYDIDSENLELPLDARIVYEKQGEFGQVVIELFQNSMDPDPGGPGVCLTRVGQGGEGRSSRHAQQHPGLLPADLGFRQRRRGHKG